MLRLYEYEAKDLFTANGIPVPRRVLVNNLEEMRDAVTKLGLPVVLKSQVLAGGRGKAGAIKKASSLEEALTFYKDLVRKTVQGEMPIAILVEEFREHVSEYYLSLTLNRSERSFVLILSASGGADVESVGKKAIITLTDSIVDKDLVTKNAIEQDVSERDAIRLAEIAEKLGVLSAKIDAELVEINPLAIVGNGEAVALDAKITLDDNALFRHPDIALLREPTGLEAEARKYGFNFVELDGNIAVIGNGAGLVLSTLDLLVENGGKPACFLDLGGGATEDVVYAALQVVGRFDKAKGILLNIFGGITRTPDVAKAVRQAYTANLIRVPFCARILGAGEQEATTILAGLQISLHPDIEGAIRKIIDDVQRIQ